MAIVLEIIMTPVFNYARRIIQDEIELAEKAALRIQNVWRNVIANPEYRLCKDRLMREFNSMPIV
jgi:hypothetical protein